MHKLVILFSQFAAIYIYQILTVLEVLLPTVLVALIVGLKTTQKPWYILPSVVFQNVGAKSTSLGPVVTYKIRQKAAFTPSTSAARDLLATFSGPRDWDDSYYSYGFLWLQKEMAAASAEMIADLRLEGKRDAMASTLSGGMQRRLCIVLFVILGMGVALPSLRPTTNPPIEISTAQFVNLSRSRIVVPYQDFTITPNYPYGNLTSQDQMFGADSANLAEADSITRNIFSVFPPFALGRGILDTALNEYYNKSDALTRVGYCPQYDALYTELTPREHLEMLARLHGYTPESTHLVSQNSLDQAFVSFVKEQTDPGGQRHGRLAVSSGDICAVARTVSEESPGASSSLSTLPSSSTTPSSSLQQNETKD
ncbi:hypothetical protein Q1695_012983 [Nippostrongylus brasiliensis]|nr:hypothetical protein Q1695_012983 [Nippostrongylus brasiliensis]